MQTGNELESFSKRRSTRLSKKKWPDTSKYHSSSATSCFGDTYATSERKNYSRDAQRTGLENKTCESNAMSREYKIKIIFVDAREYEDDMYSIVAAKKLDYYIKLMCNAGKRIG